MRKIVVLIVISLLPLVITQAQDEAAQAPIIAFADNKVYAVSAEDGQATVLAEPSTPTQSISGLRGGSISPDGKQLVYVVASSFSDPPDQYVNDLFVVTVADGKTEKITPSGGIFDVLAAKGQVIRIIQPTWSYDGQRIYYYRGQYDVSKSNKFTSQQLVYYDVSTHKHVLVKRIDPQYSSVDLHAASSGMVASWYASGFDLPPTSTLFTPDNQTIIQSEGKWVYLNALHDGDANYYGEVKGLGHIELLINIVTGEEKPLTTGYYPAAQSQAAGQDSMHVFQTWGDAPAFHIYGADQNTPITNVENNHAFTYAIAPDGQSIAYLQFGKGTQSPIYIMDIKGDVRTLDFEAGRILWGAMEYVPFLAQELG